MEQLKKTAGIISPVVWLIVIWTLSSIPAKKLSSVNILGTDKLLHIGQYLILSLLVNHSLKLLNAKHGIVSWVYLILLVMAGLDEWHQCLIPERSVSVWDFIANGIGLGIGFGLYWIRYGKSQKPVS
ncbi:MAG: VanZ family protein [Candidatus Syntrophosphaera sp.]|jgi:VanZ family protein